MKSKKPKKKRSSKNLKVNTRIVITTVLAIVIPIVLIASFSTVFISTIPSFFNFSSVTTNTYSAINQLQWSQTLSGITNELISENDENQKLDKIKEFVSPLEEFNSMIYIERDGSVFYSTADKNDILAQAEKLADITEEKNLNYFGSDGLLIVNHAQKNENSPKYKIVIVNDDYIVNDASQRIGVPAITRLLMGRTGLIVLVIVLLFVMYNRRSIGEYSTQWLK